MDSFKFIDPSNDLASLLWHTMFVVLRGMSQMRFKVIKKKKRVLQFSEDEAQLVSIHKS